MSKGGRRTRRRYGSQTKNLLQLERKKKQRKKTKTNFQKIMTRSKGKKGKPGKRGKPKETQCVERPTKRGTKKKEWRVS